MFQVIVDNHIPFILMGIVVAAGVAAKFIVSFTLKKLVKAASDMSKSSHALMRLVRAKFEHACMVSDKVQNVEVFAQKYIYEYKVLGIRLHKLQRMEMGAVWLSLVIGGVGAMITYLEYGMTELVFRTGATGAVEAMLLFLLHRVTDEKYQLEMVKTYMVDYLENVCAQRVEKNARKEEREGRRMFDRGGSQLENPERPRPREEVPSPRTSPEITAPTMPEQAPVPITNPNTNPATIPYPVQAVEAAVTETVQAERMTAAAKPLSASKAIAQKKMEKQEEKKEKLQDKFQVPKEARIREILEEFLA